MAENDKDKKSLKRMLALMNRRIRRRSPPPTESAAAAPAEAPAPAPAPAPASVPSIPSDPEPAPAPAAAEPPALGSRVASLLRRLKTAGKSPSSREDLKEALAQSHTEEKKGGAAALPAWSAKAFNRSGEKTALAQGWEGRWRRALDWGRERPYRALGAAALILLVLTLDLSTLARRLHVSEWLPVSWDPGRARIQESRPGETRADALVFLHPELDPLARSALEGGEKQPLGSWELPPRLSSMKGILMPKEWKDWRNRNAVSGLNAELWMNGDALKDMTRTALAKDSGAASPYGPAYAGLEESPESANKIRLVKGRPLGAFGQIQADEGFLGVDSGGRREVPKGVPPQEAAAEMLNASGILSQINAYNSGTAWKKLEKTNEQPVPRNFDGSSMLASEAVGQLLTTKAETDASMNCGLCGPETQVGDNRATYYGEKY